MRPEISDTVKGKLHIDRRRLVGYVAGIAAGVSYGTNPLFGKALMESGVLKPKFRFTQKNAYF